MHAAEHESEQRHRKKAKVNVRVNVRPLNANWKPVKCVEKSATTASTTSPSPALDGKVWKTKNVRVEYMEAPPTPAPSTEPEKIPGVVEQCDCGEEHCETDSLKEKQLEMWQEEKKEKEKTSSRKHRAKKDVKRHSKPRVQKEARSYSVPPNSVATPSSKKRWTKLYEQMCAPSKPLEKLPVLPPGQIGMSELDPEPEPLAEPPIQKCQEQEPLVEMQTTSPQLLKLPTMSPASEGESNVDVVPKQPKSSAEPQEPSEPVIASDEIIFLPPASTMSSESMTTAPNWFRRAEQLYYGSELHWWMLVALVMLTIFAYRSSIEQHTCYYD